VSTEDGVLTVFVFDPFPGPVPAGIGRGNRESTVRQAETHIKRI
jgi:hypothetical protein